MTRNPLGSSGIARTIGGFELGPHMGRIAGAGQSTVPTLTANQFPTKPSALKVRRAMSGDPMHTIHQSAATADEIGTEQDLAALAA
jgi:hypothetical protein